MRGLKGNGFQMVVQSRSIFGPRRDSLKFFWAGGPSGPNVPNQILSVLVPELSPYGVAAKRRRRVSCFGLPAAYNYLARSEENSSRFRRDLFGLSFQYFDLDPSQENPSGLDLRDLARLV